MPKSPASPARRRVIQSLAGGSVLLPALLSEALADDHDSDPLAPKATHFPARARSVIFLYMTGGVSHLDTFDPKPALARDHGKTIMAIDGKSGIKKLKRGDHAFKRHGKCGMEISELFPRLAGAADDICLVRSLKTDHQDHVEASLGIHTGSVTSTRPSLGSWLSYGLGTFNQNLPSFVVIAPELPYGGTQAWSADFLPAIHQGTRLIPGAEPVPHLRPRDPPRAQKQQMRFIDAMNRRHLARHGAYNALAARIRSFEVAAGMQTEVPTLLDLSRESDDTLALYGLARGQRTGFGWQCLMARRLVERGVRFVELIDKSSDNLGKRNWDAHTDMGWYRGLAEDVDRPIAGLLEDLKRRGLLAQTLVVWTTEFGRTPYEDGADGKGRGHWPRAYSSFLAGAGVKAGHIHGATDEHGAEITRDEVHVHDFHATILHLLGLDHTKLTFRHGGRDYRLTDVAGKVVQEILT